MRANYRFLLFSKSNADGTKSVVLRVIFLRKSKYFFIRRKCLPEQWDESAGRFKKNFPNFKRENDMLLNYEQRASDAIFEFEKNAMPFSESIFSEKVFGKQKPQSTKLADYIETIEEDLRDNKRLGSAEVYKNLKKMVQYFRPKTELENMTADWLSKFEQFLRVDRNMKDNSIGICFRTLRAVCNRAIKAKLVEQNWYPFADYSIARLSKNNVKKALTKDVIATIEAATTQNYREEFGRDLFLFSFYTRGMNLADIANLKPENVQSGRILYVRQKTAKVYNILLNQKSEAIVNKYAGANAYLFPIYSENHKTDEQKLERKRNVTRNVNLAIRAIAEREGLSTENLTFYAARHSYATILKNEGASVAVISQALGHADLKTTEAYLKQFENSVIDDADQLLF